MRWKPSLCCHTYPPGRGILTPFPFEGCVLSPLLGPANPRLTIIAGEPLPFRRGGFSPPFAVTAARICTWTGFSGPHGPPSAPAQRPPTGLSSMNLTPWVSAPGLSPDQSSGPPASAGELLRTP